MRSAAVLILFPLLATPAWAAPSDGIERRPVCGEASHVTLKVQPGRDVCGATVVPNAGPVSVGYLPTACPKDAPELVVDAAGPTDLCRSRVADVQVRSGPRRPPKGPS